jgi:hypothetical protein
MKAYSFLRQHSLIFLKVIYPSRALFSVHFVGKKLSLLTDCIIFLPSRGNLIGEKQRGVRQETEM